ncbi:MAG: CDP-alcohol phosphatidyltransferase family protein [Candidatus Aminicenantaceae bacterium]
MKNSQKIKIFSPLPPESIFSIPNVITLIRFVGSIVFFMLAIVKMNLTYNYIGLVIHWIGDMVDGNCARFFKQETIVGAEIDIIADRVGFLFFYVIYLVFKPELALPVALFVINFALIDFYLSYQFLKFDLISINYFYKVDQIVYKLNFSFLGKPANTVVITFTLIFFPQFWLFATVFAVGLIVVKCYSIYRLHQLEPYKRRNSEQESV